MVGKKPAKPKNPQNFKHFDFLYFHLIGSHGRQGQTWKHPNTSKKSNDFFISLGGFK